MFKTQNFCHIASNNRNTVKVGVFVYRTTDSLATVSASGYFNDRIIDINLHDLIIHEQIDNADATKVKHNLLCVTERTLENVGTTVIKTDWEEEIDEIIGDGGFVRANGSVPMLAPLRFTTQSPTFRGGIGAGMNGGVYFYDLDSSGNILTSFSSLTTDGLLPDSGGNMTLGNSTRRWKDAHIARVITSVINNGYDIAVPVTAQADTLALKSQVDLAANSGAQLYTTGVWYAKMYAATVVPTGVEYDGRNYADFSQVDNDNNPIIVIYEGQSGVWTELTRITPPAEYNGYITVTSKIWDIAEQAGQQGGKVLWSHTSKTFTPYPQIVSFEDINVTGNSTVAMPVAPSNTQIVNKQYVDDAIAAIPSSGGIKSINAGVEGYQLNIDSDGDVSGFDISNYLRFPGSIDMREINSFEIGFAFTTSSTPNHQLKFPLLAPATGFKDWGYLELYTQHGVVQAVIEEIKTGGLVGLLGTTPLAANTKYYVKLVRSRADNKYTLYLSTDGITWNTEASDNAGTVYPGIVPNGYIMGYDLLSAGSVQTIHLAECYIKRKGVITWLGFDAAGLNQRTAKGHEVIAFQIPTSANNYTWYRKYADGWVEQGGISNLGTHLQAVTLPVTMYDTNYTIQLTGGSVASGGIVNVLVAGYLNQTTSGFDTYLNIVNDNSQTAQSTGARRWFVAGIAA